MAFLDKLNDLAKNIGDKTNDAIETTRLNSRINAERAAADEELRKIGAFYYEQFVQSGEAVPEVLKFCQTTMTHYDAVAVAQGEIDRIKAENEDLKATSQQSAPTPSPVTPAGTICPACTAANAPGTKFCCSCGTKLEAPAPMEPEKRVCPGCGTEVAPGVKFCPECGNRME